MNCSLETRKCIRDAFIEWSRKEPTYRNFLIDEITETINKVGVGGITIEIILPDYPNKNLWTNAEKTDKNPSSLYLLFLYYPNGDIEWKGFTDYETLTKKRYPPCYVSPDTTYRVSWTELTNPTKLPEAIENKQKQINFV